MFSKMLPCIAGLLLCLFFASTNSLQINRVISDALAYKKFAAIDRFPRSVAVNMGNIAEFGDFAEEGNVEVDNRTDEEKGVTNGYEGDFKTGDIVRVKNDIRIWSVKQYSKEGFNCKGFEGKVVGMDMYGRKFKVTNLLKYSTYI
jgi:uncharacterized protein YodC (DUF2158 family)